MPVQREQLEADVLIVGAGPAGLACALHLANLTKKYNESGGSSKSGPQLSSENIPQAEALAKALGGEIAASRPICDEGWLPMERQIGSSGQTVAPKLYLALGISGAIQHVVGMKGARTIVAINKDSNAPIFEIADYGVVGDIFEIMPALTEALEKAKTG